MTQENKTPTVDEMNIVIADFMGYYYHASKFYSKNSNPSKWFKEAKYHLSWDALMPVWVKFRNLALDNKEFSDWCSSLGWYLYCSSSAPLTFHERLYYAIEWYNQQNKPNG